MIFGGNSYYFLASRCTGLGSEMAFFGLRTIGWEELSSVITCCSEGKQYGGEGNYGVVPVVTLGSDIQYEKVGSGVWNIKE